MSAPERSGWVAGILGCPGKGPVRPSAALNPVSGSRRASGAAPGAATGRVAVPPPEQVAFLVATAGRRRLAEEEAQVLRLWFAASHRAVRASKREAEQAGAELFAALVELRAMRARWSGGPSALTPKAGATPSAARALAARWDQHWPTGGAR